MDLKKYITSNFVIGLSPMDGVTDEPFRLLLSKVARPGVYFTEFVNVEGLSRGGIKLYDQLLYSATETPIIGQLFGKTPECFYKSAVVLSELGFDGIDVNMGCQAKRITQHGSGGALINKPDLAAEIIDSVKRGIDDWYSSKVTIENLGLSQKTLDVIDRNLKYSGKKDKLKPTVSVKTRLGFNKVVTDSWIPFILKQGIDLLTLHGRIVTQGHGGGVANWEEIAQAAIMAKEKDTIIWGNGDVQSRQQAIEYCQKYGVNGVLIGRAVMGNPWLFKDYLPTIREKYETILLHSQIYKDVFPSRRLDSLRRHFLLYASGHPHAKQLRAKLVALSSIDDILHLEEDFLSC